MRATGVPSTASRARQGHCQRRSPWPRRPRAGPARPSCRYQRSEWDRDTGSPGWSAPSCCRESWCCRVHETGCSRSTPPPPARRRPAGVPSRRESTPARERRPQGPRKWDSAGPITPAPAGRWRLSPSSATGCPDVGRGRLRLRPAPGKSRRQWRSPCPPVHR